MLVSALSASRRTASDDSSPATRSPQASRGQVLPLFALFLIVLIGFSAVAVDLGSWLQVRRDYQNAADAAALAGAPFLVSSPGSPPDWLHARAAAWASLKAQLGITIPATFNLTMDTPAGTPVQDSSGTYSMWVSTPPIGSGGVTAAKYPGASIGSTDKAIFVWIQRVNPSYLARIFGINGSMISAWATAGLFPTRYAVITLRQPNQAGPAQADINLAGTNVTLTVINGDVGGNYNMKLNSNSNLALPNDSQVYLHDYLSCGQQCWGNTQITNGGTPAPSVLKTVLQLPGPIPDPNYSLPTSVTSAPTAPTVTLPFGYVGDPKDKKSSSGSVVVGTGGDKPANTSVNTVGGVLTCDGTNAVRIGPGYYTNISVAGSYCVILDPTMTHTCITLGTCTDSPAAVTKPQMPGIFYVNGTISVGNGAMIVGDGVTVVLRPDNSSDKNNISIAGGASSPATVDLNDGSSPLVATAETSAAWTRTGLQPYTWDSTNNVWKYTSAYESTPAQAGVALYVMRRDQIPGLVVASDDNSNAIKVGANAALTWNGITYAPHDNVTLAGQPGHGGVGQLVCWTFTFNGGSNVTQTYSGPISGIPWLIEPKLGQP